MIYFNLRAHHSKCRGNPYNILLVTTLLGRIVLNSFVVERSKFKNTNKPKPYICTLDFTNRVRLTL